MTEPPPQGMLVICYSDSNVNLYFAVSGDTKPSGADAAWTYVLCNTCCWISQQNFLVAQVGSKNKHPGGKCYCTSVLASDASFCAAEGKTRGKAVRQLGPVKRAEPSSQP